MLLPWIPLPKALETLTYSYWLCLRNNKAGGGRPGDEASAVCKHGGRSHCNGKQVRLPSSLGTKDISGEAKGDMLLITISRRHKELLLFER